MKDFVFILPLTPSVHITPLRQDLFQLTLSSLRKQTSDNWQAILVGEYDKVEGNLIYLPTKPIVEGYEKKIRSSESATDKHFKIDIALQYIAKQPQKPKYLIRLDDDDVFSPVILSQIEKMEYDCYVDRYHTYYDITSGKICQNPVPWYPNTVIHKYEHAVANIPRGSTIDEPEGDLIACSHNIAFHKYYKDKKVFFTEKSNPIYVRTITMSTVSFKYPKSKLEYKEYLSTYGEWYYRRIESFEPYIDPLVKLAQKHLGIVIARNFSEIMSFKDWMINKVTRYKKRVVAKLKRKDN
jgi:hypothetical protein